MSMNKREVGTLYEDMACRYLEDEGLKIIGRNYRVKIGEIDIIAMENDTLVFAEVKFRSSTDYGGAEFAISRQKQKKIMRVAQWYMAECGIRSDTVCRFDAVLIDGQDVVHIRNAWQL